MRLMMLVPAFAIACAASATAAEGARGEYVAKTRLVDDQKAVIATVEPLHQLVARARIGGTIISLKVREGDQVSGGTEIAMVGDPKLPIQIKAFDSRIQSQQAVRDQAKADFERAQDLQRRGAGTQVALELARTAFDVAERNLAALETDRAVVVQQLSEGSVLAPGDGRVLTVPVTEGRVVLAGETIATLAEAKYILRLQLPERHAQVMRAGDVVMIGARGLGPSNGKDRQQGRVRLVYPEIQGGRVIADVEVAELGDYFVGERTRVYVSTGQRSAIMVPASYVYRRAGVNYVRLKGGAEVAVQPGEIAAGEVEILSGLKDGDVLVSP